MSDDLPEIAFRTEGGRQTRVRYERDSDDPTRVHRIVEARQPGDEWRPVGSEELVELAVDGEHRMPRGVLGGSR